MLANALPLLTTGELRLLPLPLPPDEVPLKRSAEAAAASSLPAGDGGAPNRLAAFPMLMAFVRRGPLLLLLAIDVELSFAPS